jgi:hypothetical protein
MEYSSPHPRLIRKERRRGGKTKRNTESRSSSAKEMEDRPEKDKADR